MTFTQSPLENLKPTIKYECNICKYECNICKSMEDVYRFRIDDGKAVTTIHLCTLCYLKREFYVNEIFTV